MREAFGSVRKAFTQGLEPESAMNGADFLSRCHNAKCTEVDCKKHEPFSAPPSLHGQAAIDLAGMDDWPFPQYYSKTANPKNLFFTRTAVYDDNDPLVTNIPSGGAWHIAEHPGLLLACNGSAVVYQRNGVDGNPALLSGVSAQSVCAAGETMVLGGLGGTRISHAEFQELYTAWKANTGDVTSGVSTGVGSVMWFSPGGSIAGRPFEAELSALGAGSFANYRSMLHDAISEGRIGFVSRDIGTVRCVKALGSNAVVYGSKAVGILDSVYGDDGINRFRWKPIMNIGIGGRGYVAGDLSTHYFVDTSGVLWMLAGDGPARLGYSSFFAPLVSADASVPVVSGYDPVEREAYFAARTQSYVYRQAGGLSSRSDAPTLVQRVAGALKSLVYGAYSTDFEIVTGRFDYNQRELKSIQCMTVSVADATALQAALQYRYAGETAWRDGPWIPLNPDGAAFPMATAVDFRMKIKGAFGTDGRIDYAYHRWKLSGRRSIRGLYGQD